MEPRQRKRDAVGNLRELAQQLGVATGPSASDWKKEEFLTVHRSVEASPQGTPEHKQKATDARALYFGTVPSAKQTRKQNTSKTNTQAKHKQHRSKTQQN